VGGGGDLIKDNKDMDLPCLYLLAVNCLDKRVDSNGKYYSKYHTG